MSLLIPNQTVDLLRTFNNIALDLYGIDCTLYVVNNIEAESSNDAYISPSDLTFTTYTERKVWIEWKPDMHRLRKLGIYVEDDLPILAWFKNDIEIPIKSYFSLSNRYIPDVYDTDKFQIVDVVLRNMYNAEIFRLYKIAPLRT